MTSKKYFKLQYKPRLKYFLLLSVAYLNKVDFSTSLDFNDLQGFLKIRKAKPLVKYKPLLVLLYFHSGAANSWEGVVSVSQRASLVQGHQVQQGIGYLQLGRHGNNM